MKQKEELYLVVERTREQCGRGQSHFNHQLPGCQSLATALTAAAEGDDEEELHRRAQHVNNPAI